eukprot:TRINITY_DN13768_c0_g2_i1.p1 TRINITY_DN13768_c0_g2~~TRINITY_DN13768_c0_g2_i1.p1  ORF type:complete len:826 (-),score=137.52 TRINITY_DN13768_c0_g2_i1:81-2558(-)
MSTLDDGDVSASQDEDGVMETPQDTSAGMLTTEPSDMEESTVSEMSESDDDAGRWGFLTKTRKKLDGFAQAFAASWRRGGDEESLGEDDDDLPAEMAVDHDHVRDKEYRIADHHARMKRRASMTAQSFLEFAPRAKISRAVSAPVWLVGTEDLVSARDKALTDKQEKPPAGGGPTRKTAPTRSLSSPSLLLSTLHVRFKAHLPDVRKPSLNVPGFGKDDENKPVRPRGYSASTSGRSRGFGKATSSPSMSRSLAREREAAAAGKVARPVHPQRAKAMSSAGAAHVGARGRVPIARTISSPARLSPLSKIAVVVEARQTKDPQWLAQVRLRRDSDIEPVPLTESGGGRGRSSTSTSKRRLGFAKTLSTPTIDRSGLPPISRRSVSPALPSAQPPSEQPQPGQSSKDGGKKSPIPLVLPAGIRPASPAMRAMVHGPPKRASVEEARIARAVSSPLPVVSEWMERLFAGQKAKAAAAAAAAGGGVSSKSPTPPARSPLRLSSGSEAEASDDPDATTSAPVPMTSDSATVATGSTREPSATQAPMPRSPNGAPSRFVSAELAELSSPEVSSVEGSPSVGNRGRRERQRTQPAGMPPGMDGVYGMDPDLAYPAEIEWELDPTTGQLTQAEEFESRKMAVLYCVFTAGILESHVNGPCDSLALYQWISDMQVALELPCSVILLSLIYVERLHSRQSHLEFSESALRGLFLMAMLTASKYAEDETYPNRAWSNLTNGQFDIGMFNDMEHEFLFLLGWSVHVTEEEYEEYRSYAIRGDEGAQEWKAALAILEGDEDDIDDDYGMYEDAPEVPLTKPPELARPPGLPAELEPEQ